MDVLDPTLVPWPESQNHSRWCHSHSWLVYFPIFTRGRIKQANCVNNNLVPRERGCVNNTYMLKTPRMPKAKPERKPSLGGKELGYT